MWCERVEAFIGASVVLVEDPVSNTAGTIAAMATRRMAKMLNPITFDFFDIPTMMNIAIEKTMNYVIISRLNSVFVLYS